MSEALLSVPRHQQWARRLKHYEADVEKAAQFIVEGSLRRVVGLTLEAAGCDAAIGSYCEVTRADGKRIAAEVVGFEDDRIFLMPTGDIRGMTSNARVTPTLRATTIGVGEHLLGRVLDGAGQPIDGKGAVRCDAQVQLHAEPINPLLRQPITEPLDVGVRSINAFMSLGRGQRVGLFAGSGVGKSVLLGMMTRNTEADVVVVGLIGERGREVQEFIDQSLGAAGMARAVVVATPSDHPPLMRIHGALLATRIAEYYRDCGLKVLLLMDSLTRYAQARREVALAIGEAPVTKGYPPSVFASLPELVERAGNSCTGQGSITAVYTVLTEGDDDNDPIADAARSILDGHIMLSRQMAGAGIFPAVDVQASISRVMQQVVSPEHQQMAQLYRRLNALYEENRDLISVGAYTAGTDANIDMAISLWPKMMEFMCQDLGESADFNSALADLQQLLTSGAPVSSEQPLNG